MTAGNNTPGPIRAAAAIAALCFVSACGTNSAQSTAPSTQASSPVPAASAPPPLNVTAAAEDFTGKPAPAGAVVMTMANLMFSPAAPVATGAKIILYVDNTDPEKSDCPGAPGSDVCYQHGLLVLGPGGSLLGTTDVVAPGHQALLTLDRMRPGTYKFYCPVLVHRFLGMTGVLKVS